MSIEKKNNLEQKKKDSDLGFTTIFEKARKFLDVSRDEYALCNYVQTWSAHPKNRQSGWCDRTQEQISEWVGISVRGLRKMVNRMVEKNLLEQNDGSRLLRITEYWFSVTSEAKTLHNSPEQSSAGTGTKFLSAPEQSSASSRNKVPTHNKSNNKSNKKGDINEENAPKKTALSATIHTPQQPIENYFVTTVEHEVIDLEENQKSKPAAKPKKQTAVWKVDPGREIEELRNDYRCKEQFFTNYRIPVDLFEDYVQRFELKIGSEQEEHLNRPAFRRHFFAWAALEYKREQKGDRPTANTPDGLLKEISDWYHKNPLVWDGAKKFAGVQGWAAPKLKAVVQKYCARQIADGRGGDTFDQHNARIQSWFLTETQASVAAPSMNGNGREHLQEPKFRN